MSIQALKSVGFSIKLNTVNFLTSFAGVSLTGLALGYLQWPKALKTTLGMVVSTYIPALIFKDKSLSWVQFLKTNPLLVALNIAEVISQQKRFSLGINVSLSLLNQIEKNIPPSLAPIDLQEEATFVNDVLRPTLVEHLFFRVMIQEMLLKQLPQLVFPALVNHSAAKIARVTLSGCIFGLAHLPKYASLPVFSDDYAPVKLSPLVTKILQGLSNAYLQETLGFFPSLIAHYGNNFMDWASGKNFSSPSFQG